MNILYAARMGRYDLLKPVGTLAGMVSKWNSDCDKRLHRLMCYIHPEALTQANLAHRLVGSGRLGCGLAAHSLARLFAGGWTNCVQNLPNLHT